MDPIYIHLRKIDIFRNLANAQLDRILAFSEVKIYHTNQTIIANGEMQEHILLVLEGELNVIPTESSGTTRILQKGDNLGGLNLLDTQPPPYSVRATSHAMVLRIPIEELIHLTALQPELYATLPTQLQRAFNSLIDTSTNKLTYLQELALAHDRLIYGRFLCNLLIGLSTYVFVLGVIMQYKSQLSTTTYISIPVLLIFLTNCIVFTLRSGKNFSYFGLSIQHWQRNIIEGILFSIPILIIMPFVKYLAILILPEFRNATLFFSGKEVTQLSVVKLSAVIILYNSFVLVQEFIARGVIQNVLQHFFIDHNRILMGIFIANVLFTVTHAFLPLIIILGSFVLGFFWGWLCWRQKSLLGAVVSHMIIGSYGYFIVGFM